MPSSSLSFPPLTPTHNLHDLLDSACHFLRPELESIDLNLPSLITVLHSIGTTEFWHKNITFFDHLVNMYRILKLWKFQDSVSLCALFHNAYNINLPIFGPPATREVERLIHLFCLVQQNEMFRSINRK